jgi:hypothetical protein
MNEGQEEEHVMAEQRVHDEEADRMKEQQEVEQRMRDEEAARMKERHDVERVVSEERAHDEEANSSERGVPSASPTDDTALDVATAYRKSPPELGHQFNTETNTPIRRSARLSNKEGVPCTAPSNEDDEDENYNDRDDDEDHEDDVGYEGRDSFNDTDINGDDPVLAELGPNDIMYGVHNTQMCNHQGNMSARELALLHYQEYSETNSRTFKSTLVARLIKRLEDEGRKFLLKTRDDGWRTMSYDEKHIRFSRMLCDLNRRPNVKRVKVKPKETVVSKQIWDEKDSKTLREYITQCDVDDEFKWGRIAKKLNRSESACKVRMRMILECGIYGEEKTGEHI